MMGPSVIEIVDPQPDTSLVLVELIEPATVSRPGLMRRGWRGVCAGAEWLFGIVSLILGLAILAASPLVQFASLGYLLEVSGRTIRERRVPAGWFGMQKAARAGGVALGVLLPGIPLIVLARWAHSARLIDPGGRSDRFLTRLLIAASALALVHVASALWRGGRLRQFLWPAPISTLRFFWFTLWHPLEVYRRSRDSVCEYVESLRLPYYWWLGLRGAAGGFVWLAGPITLIVIGGGRPLFSLVGSLALAIVLLYLPFLQARFAAENRLSAMFEVRAVRRLFRQAPLAYVVALALTLIFAVPLYLLKIEMIPRDAAWLTCLFFVVFTWPARWATGWALARATRRTTPRNWFVRQFARLAMLLLVAAYVLIVYLTRYTSWYGLASLYAQHPFLVPVPFLVFPSN